MTFPWKNDRHITHRSFRIVDLVGDQFIIMGRTFEDCTIYGPAVVVPLDHISFEYSSFDATADAILWEIPEGKEIIVGGIGLVDCTFLRCRFEGIGIAGNRFLIEKFASELGGSPPPPIQPTIDQPQDE